jgi:hypothetical protein
LIDNILLWTTWWSAKAAQDGSLPLPMQFFAIRTGISIPYFPFLRLNKPPA